MTHDDHTQPDDFVERAQARLERMNEVAEELARELDLPPTAKYDLLAAVYDQDGAAETATRQAPEHLALAASLRDWLARISLPLGIGIGVGMLSFVLGLLIVHVAKISVLFAAPTALFITALVLALAALVRWIDGIAWKRAAFYSVALTGQGTGQTAPLASGSLSMASPRRSTTGARVPTRKRLRERSGIVIATCCLLAASAASLGLTLLNPLQIQRIEQKSVVTAPSITIGISYGSLAFDVNRPDGQLKLRAASEMAAGNTSAAINDWRQAVEQDSSDAESLIYLEDQRVLAANRPYITLVVGTQFSKENVSDGRDDLQAAYVVQKAYNDRALASGGVMLRLLVAAANADDHGSVTTVAREIVQEARKDSTIKAVMGWPTSASTRAALAVLSAARIPLVSPTASADNLNTGDDPFFFRVSPTNQEQAYVAAQYAQQVLHAQRIALFVDQNDPYSHSLAHDFAASFTSKNVIIWEPYTEGEPDTMLASLRNALPQRPDLIYFSGYASDVGTILKNLSACRVSNQRGCLLVMGGDGLYLQGDFALGSLTNYDRLRFTAFTFPVAGKGQTADQKQFLAAFTHTYDPNNQYQPGTYGYNLPESHTMLSYDTMRVLLYASDTLMTYGDVNFRPEDLQAALSAIDVEHPFAGLSWPIAFGPLGNDVNGRAVIIAGSANGKLSLVWQG